MEQEKRISKFFTNMEKTIDMIHVLPETGPFIHASSDEEWEIHDKDPIFTCQAELDYGVRDSEKKIELLGANIMHQSKDKKCKTKKELQTDFKEAQSLIENLP